MQTTKLAIAVMLATGLSRRAVRRTSQIAQGQARILDLVLADDGRQHEIQGRRSVGSGWLRSRFRPGWHHIDEQQRHQQHEVSSGRNSWKGPARAGPFCLGPDRL